MNYAIIAYIFIFNKYFKSFTYLFAFLTLPTSLCRYQKVYNFTHKTYKRISYNILRTILTHIQFIIRHGHVDSFLLVVV